MTTKEVDMNTITRWDQSRGLTSLQDQVNRLFEGSFTHDRSGHADLATWAPPVDIYETENELVIKADLPDLEDKDIDVRVENNSLTIRGERKFEKEDRKSTRLNSSHSQISYAVFCLKKKKSTEIDYSYPNPAARLFE